MNRTAIAASATAAASIAAALAITVPASASETNIPATMRHPGPCPVSQLSATLSGEKAATGAHRWTLTITNDGKSCTITGYPRLRERTPAGALAYPVTIHGPVLGVPDEGPQTVTLAGGGTVTAVIGYGDDGSKGETVVARLYAGFRNVAGWVPVTGMSGPVNVYENAISTTAWEK